MNKKIVAQNCDVVIGVDVHAESHVLAADVLDRIVDRYRMVGVRQDWQSYLERFPGCTLTVIYESGPFGYNLGDMLKEMSAQTGQRLSLIHI